MIRWEYVLTAVLVPLCSFGLVTLAGHVT